MSDDSPRNHENDPEDHEISTTESDQIKDIVSIEIIKPVWRGFVFGMSAVLGAFTLSQVMGFDRSQFKLYIFVQLVNCLPIA